VGVRVECSRFGQPQAQHQCRDAQAGCLHRRLRSTCRSDTRAHIFTPAHWASTVSVPWCVKQPSTLLSHADTPCAQCVKSQKQVTQAVPTERAFMQTYPPALTAAVWAPAHLQAATVLLLPTTAHKTPQKSHSTYYYCAGHKGHTFAQRMYAGRSIVHALLSAFFERCACLPMVGQSVPHSITASRQSTKPPTKKQTNQTDNT
jgi:hypothetical protein